MESQLRGSRPRTVFVTGGPGSGKGTQCANMVKELKYEHTSVGDLMRNEIKQGTDEGRAVEAIVKSGNLVPKELTINLLLKTIEKLKARTVLIDGFPRSTEQAVYLEQITQPIDFILHFDTDREDILVNRLIERGKSSGRADDKEETIVYRFQVYKSESAPVVNLYDPFNIIRRVDCLAPINEVYKRAVRALRPEVFFIIGPLYSGKSSICKFLASRYNLTWITIDSIKLIQKKGKKPVVLTEDLEIANQVLNVLQNLREEYRVVIEGFPENVNQAKHFARLIGEPNRVVYLRCSKDIAQIRLLQSEKHAASYTSPAVTNNLYEKFSANIEAICTYYKTSSIAKYYGEVLAEYTLDEVIRRVEALIIPEVVMVRGEVHAEFLNYMAKQGYKLVNCVILLDLWRNARGLSNSASQDDFSEDPELIPILRSLIFSGNGVCRFVIYNFALQFEELLKEFENEVCSISISYYLSPKIPVLADKPSHFLYNIGKLKAINTSKISEESIKTQLKELEEANKSWCVVVIGPSQSGKTSVCKILSEISGFLLMDYNQVFEEAKVFHSTEEDQRETVTFSEFLLAIGRFFEKNTQKTIVVDGLPPSDILFGPDPKYPAFPTPASEEEGFVLEEDPITEHKLKLAVKRIEDFFKTLRVLLRIQLEAPTEVLETRIKIKLEIPAEEGLSVEGKKELLETWRVYEKIAIEEDLIQNAIPRCLTFNTSKSSLPSLTSVLSETFARKIILVRGYHLIDEIISMFCWRNQLFYIDLSKVLYNAADRLDALGESVRKGNIDHNVTIALLKETIEHRGIRDKIIVICGYGNDPELEYESSFEELVHFEQEIGNIIMLINVQNGPEDVEIEPLPVRKRKEIGKNPDGNSKDKPVDQSVEEEDEEEEKNEEDAKNFNVPEEDDAEIPMWNHNMRSGFCKTFHNFKGKRAELIEVNMIRQGSLNLLLEHLQQGLEGNLRYNIQVVTDLVVEEVLQSELSMLSFPMGSVFRQELPLDIRDLGNVTAKVNKILTNSQAAIFFKQVFIGLCCPFSVFWENFQPFIEAENWKTSKELRSAVKEVVDPHKTGFISVEELNYFFDCWGNPEKKAEISIKSQSRIKKQGEFPENSLVMVVESSSPDPATNAKTFVRGSKLEISSTGYSKSERSLSDGTVYFGKANKRAKNDIEFSSADTRINFLHFLIRCKRKGYFLVDNGGKNGVKVRVHDNPVHLLKDFVVNIAEHTFRISHLQNPAPRRDDSILALQFKYYPPVIEGDSEFNLEFISEELKGQVFKFSGEKKRITFGSAPDSDVYLPRSDYVHAIIELRSVGWCIIDQHSSTGSFVHVMTWDRFSEGKPSRQLHLHNLMHIALPGTEFKLIVKQDLDTALDLSKNPMIRLEKFRRLYRIGKYIRPGSDFKEFECVHKPSRDKCMVSVVASKIITSENLEKIQNFKNINNMHMHRVLEIIEDGPYFYVISEFLHGNDLQEVVNLKSAISEEQAAGIFKNMVLALKTLHDQGIVHGNIRPEYFVTINSAKDDGALKITGVLRNILAQDTSLLEFQAPEFLMGKSSFASDVWSCGVILYLLLTGTHPFKGNKPEETKAYLKRASPNFKQSLWEGVSPYVKILLKTILVKDPRNRPSCAEILENNWLNGKIKFLDLSLPLSSKAFKDLKAYMCNNKLYNGLFLFIHRVLASNQEKEQALETFRQLDSEMTGKLSRTEILSAFEYLHIELTEGELESIIREVDVNMTGTVDYVEFLGAIGNKRKAFNSEKLESVFRNFDTDSNGFITANELKTVVGEGNWSEIIKQVDANEDGKIDIKEFKNLVLNMISSL